MPSTPPPRSARHFVTASGSLGYTGSSAAGSTAGIPAEASSNATGSKTGATTSIPAPNSAGRNRSATNTPTPIARTAAASINAPAPIAAPSPSNPVTHAVDPLAATFDASATAKARPRDIRHAATLADGTAMHPAPVTSAIIFAALTAILTAVNPPGPTDTATRAISRGRAPILLNRASTAAISPSDRPRGSIRSTPTNSTAPPTSRPTATPGITDASPPPAPGPHADGLLVSIAITRSGGRTAEPSAGTLLPFPVATPEPAMPPTRRRPCQGILLALALAPAALAQTSPAEVADTAESAIHAPARFTLRVEPAVWYAGVSGDLTLPSADPAGDTTPVDVNNLGVDNSRLTPLGEFSIARGRWGGGARGFIYTTDRNATGILNRVGDLEIVPADTVRTSFDIANMEIEGTYRFFDGDRRWTRRTPMGKRVFSATLDAVAGARLYDVDIDVVRVGESAPGAVSAAAGEETFVEPLAGIRYVMEFYEQADVNIQMTVGGLPLADRDSLSLDIIVGFAWHPIDHVGLQVGYRALFMDLGSGDGGEAFEFDGTLQGLYFGAVFAF